MENLDELRRLIKENDAKATRIGVLTERSRIMDGLAAADLPVGVWTLIKNVISPHEDPDLGKTNESPL